MTNRQNLGIPTAASYYFIKRFRRVYPIYWIYTAAVLCMGALAFLVINKNYFIWADLSAVGLARTFLLLPTDVPSNVMPVLPVAWTLSYEILFYLLFSITFLFKPKISLVLAFVWVAAIAARSLGYLGTPTPTSVINLFTEARNLEFLLGCLAAWIVSLKRIPIRMGQQMVVFGVILLGISWANAHLDFRWMSKAEVLQFGLPFFLIVCGSAAIDLKKTINIGLTSRLAIFLGDASYSIYLTHFIVIVVVSAVMKRMDLPSLLIFIVSVGAALALGLISYVLIENPLMRTLKGNAKKIAGSAIGAPLRKAAGQ